MVKFVNYATMMTNKCVQGQNLLPSLNVANQMVWLNNIAIVILAMLERGLDMIARKFLTQ